MSGPIAHRTLRLPAGIALSLAFTAAAPLWAESSGPARGTLVVDGGGATDAVRDRFVALAGGPTARIVVIPTAASSIRFGDDNTILDLDVPRDRPEWAAYDRHLRKWFGAEGVTILHTRDRAVADSEAFVAPLRGASAVYLAAGNAGRLASAYRKTRTHHEIEALLDRGGVVFGSSAGAIIQGSFIVRGRPDKPILMARGRDRGFGFLKEVAINPHLTSAKRDAELVNVVDAHPNLLGLGIDDDAALIVQGDRFQVIGTGRVAVYDNAPHPGGWYYWLRPGDQFDLRARRKMAPVTGPGPGSGGSGPARPPS
jgi:cyanophycinase